MRDKVSLPRLYISWPTPPDLDADDAPLDVLQAVMSDGISSRLHRSLVYEQQIAQSVGIRYHPSEIAGQFMVVATAAEGHSLAEVEAAVDAEMEKARQAPPSKEEMDRVKNRRKKTLTPPVWMTSKTSSAGSIPRPTEAWPSLAISTATKRWAWWNATLEIFLPDLLYPGWAATTHPWRAV